MNKKKNKSFAGLLKKVFVLIILVPTLCLGGFMLYSSFKYVREQKIAETFNGMEQNLTDLNNRMAQCEKSIVYATSNYSLHQFLKIDTSKYMELREESKSIGPLLNNTVLSNQYFKKLKIYTESDHYVLKDIFVNKDSVEDEEWYQTTLESEDTFWWYQDSKFYISRAIRTMYPVKTIGVMRVELNSDIFKSSFNIFQDYPMNISLKEKGKTFYQYLRKEKNDCIFKGMETTYELAAPQWSIVYYMDGSFYSQNITTGIVIPMLIICFVLLIAWVLVRVFSGLLVKDLFVLVKEVNEIQKGNLDIAINSSELEEIDTLAGSIRSMIRRINQLISQVYTKEIERQNLELNLLQSKISPHFLYNNLSTINWLAMSSGQAKISQITTEMTAFYRTALNKGNNVDKLSIEIENAKAYLKLQLISHEDSFDVEYQLDDSILSHNVPIFILQPLLENSIEHGINQLRDERGIIRISGWIKGDDLYLAVYDNGKELYERIGYNFLKESEYGYGTSNVHKRVQLICGKEYGLSIKADSHGTVATISLLIGSWINI